MKHQRFLLIGIILIFITALYMYRIGSIPPGLSNDEANIGYEAWSIATTGKDQWGNTIPLVFEGFGNWSLPVYIYVLALFIKLFGPTIFIVRFPSIIAGVLLSGLSYVLLKKLRSTSHNWFALVGSAVVGFTPWIFGLSRTANEVVLSMAFFLGGVVLLTYSQERKHIPVASAILFSLAMLTYYGMWVFVPLFLLAFSIKNAMARQLRIDRIFSAIVVSIIVVLLLSISIQQGGNKRFKQVNIFNDPALVGILNEKRGSCIEYYPGFLCQFFFNRPLMYGITYVSNYFSHISFREWFITNSGKGILPSGGFFLLIQAPMFFIGIFSLWKLGNQTEKRIFYTWLLLAPIADSVTSGGNFTRSFMMAPVVALVSSYSLLAFPRIVKFFVFILFLLAVGSFFLLYTALFPKENSIYTHYEYQPLISYLKDEKGPIFLSSRFRDTKQYIFLLFYGKISPDEFQNRTVVTTEREPDGWLWVKQVNNWHFLKSLPIMEDLPSQAFLVGATKEEIEPLMKQYERCEGIQIELKTIIRYRNNDPAFSIVEIQKPGLIECPKVRAI